MSLRPPAYGKTDPDWEYVTDLNSKSKPGTYHTVSRYVGNSFKIGLNTLACSCKGYVFRKRCDHVDAVKAADVIGSVVGRDPALQALQRAAQHEAVQIDVFGDVLAEFGIKLSPLRRERLLARIIQSGVCRAAEPAPVERTISAQTGRSRRLITLDE